LGAFDRAWSDAFQDSTGRRFQLGHGFVCFNFHDGLVLFDSITLFH
jgi:hypothetical protein